VHLSKIFKVTFQYIPNVVDTEFFVPNMGKKNSANAIQICSVGNLTKNKNHTLLISAVKILLEKGIKIKLVIAGFGSEMAALKQQIKALNLTKHVYLAGPKSRAGVLELLQSSDFFVLPSKKETFGVVLIEAMSCGLPVLALDNGGSKSIINKNVGAISTNEGDFPKHISMLINHNYDRQLIRQHTLENYSPQVIAKKLLRAFVS
jgi:glycosyltransferase involved in cell wall biosynthesis